MVTGRTPFTGVDEEGNELSAASVMTLQLNGIVPKPSQFNPHITPALEAVLLKSLKKGPAERFQSAAEFARALTAAIPYDPEEDSQRFSIVSPERAADSYSGAAEEASTSPSPDSLPEPRIERPEAPSTHETPTRSLESHSDRPAGRTPPPDISTATTVTPNSLSQKRRRVMRVAAGRTRTGRRTVLRTRREATK